MAPPTIHQPIGYSHYLTTNLTGYHLHAVQLPEIVSKAVKPDKKGCVVYVLMLFSFIMFKGWEEV